MAERKMRRSTRPLLRPDPGSTLVRPASAGLIALIAIMTFLAALTLGTVHIARDLAGAWRSGVAREVTIQLRPSAGKEMEAQIERAINLAKMTRGVRTARALSDQETKRLLEPWLGANADLRAIPVPRLLVVELADPDADIASLRKALAEQIAGASIDDHRGYQGRLARTADAISATGLAILAMVLAATVLSVMIATRGAVTANRDVVEVLHFVGARERFIAGAFQRHFLIVGLKGAAIGALLAAAAFVVSYLTSADGRGTATAFITARPTLGLIGYVQIVVLAVLIASLVAITSRFTVKRVLRIIG